MVMFDALQKAFEKQNPCIMKSALQTTARTLGHQLEDRVRRIGFSILDLLSLSNFDYQIHEGPPSGAFQDLGLDSQDDIVITNRVHWLGTLFETTFYEPGHAREEACITMEKLPTLDAIDDVVVGLGSGLEVASLPSLDFGW